MKIKLTIFILLLSSWILNVKASANVDAPLISLISNSCKWDDQKIVTEGYLGIDSAHDGDQDARLFQSQESFDHLAYQFSIPVVLSKVQLDKREWFQNKWVSVSGHYDCKKKHGLDLRLGLIDSVEQIQLLPILTKNDPSTTIKRTTKAEEAEVFKFVRNWVDKVKQRDIKLVRQSILGPEVSDERLIWAIYDWRYSITKRLGASPRENFVLKVGVAGGMYLACFGSNVLPESLSDWDWPTWKEEKESFCLSIIKSKNHSNIESLYVDSTDFWSSN